MQTNRVTIKIECEKIKISELMQILQNVENGIKNKTTGESEIYIQEVAKGSMIFDIIQIIPLAVLPFVENINSVFNFIEHFNKIKEIFKNKKTEVIQKDDISIIKNLGGIVNVIKDCSDANITINNITNNFNLNTSESRDIQPRISHYLASQADQEEDLGKSNIIHNALIYYHQTNIKKDESNKAICEKVSIKPIKTIPNNEEIRAKILENPYGYNFIVDLEVQYRNRKPALYTILKLIDRDEKDG